MVVPPCCLLCTHLFYGRPSTYWWEEDSGTVHSINQGEGGEQGDPLMPLFFAVGQHPALVATQDRINGGKTHVWNAAGVEPPVCEALQRIAEASDPVEYTFIQTRFHPILTLSSKRSFIQ